MRALFAAAVGASILAMGSVLASAALTPQQIVDDRVARMKSMAGAMKAASQAPTPAEAKTKLALALTVAEAIPSLFPKGSGMGDAGVTQSRAMQEIWTKPAEFKAAADAALAALKGLDAAMGTGDNAQIEAAWKKVGPSCGGCHTAFRKQDAPPQ